MRCPISEAENTREAIAAAPVVKAGYGRRFGAFIVDGILAGLLLGITERNIGRIGDWFGSPAWWATGVWIVTSLLDALYYIQPYATTGQTFGEKVFRIRVVTLDGSPLNWRFALLRWLGAWLSLIPIVLGYLWAIWDRDKQAWHDKLAGTTVVKQSSPSAVLVPTAELRHRQKRWEVGLGVASVLAGW